MDRKKEGYGALLSLYGQIGKIGTISRDHYFVLGKLFGRFQFDAHLFILLGFDGNQLFQPVVMQTQTLNGDIIFAGGHLGNGDTLSIISSKHLVNNTGTGAVITIENDQDRILMINGSGDLVELETDGSCINQGFILDIGASGSRAGPGVRLHCSAEEQAKEESK
jgi:hypothetical protein